SDRPAPRLERIPAAPAYAAHGGGDRVDGGGHGGGPVAKPPLARSAGGGGGLAGAVTRGHRPGHRPIRGRPSVPGSRPRASSPGPGSHSDAFPPQNLP